MKFSIRDLLLVTVIVALGLGWFCHWRVLSRRYDQRGEYTERLKERLGETLFQKTYILNLLERDGRRYVIPTLRAGLPADLENEP